MNPDPNERIVDELRKLNANLEKIGALLERIAYPSVTVSTPAYAQPPWGFVKQQ